MNPLLRGGEYVFCAISHHAPVPAAAVAVFREDEATTVVLEKRDAEAHGLEPVYRAAWITLTIHSDLDAIGFLATISRTLAEVRISCNVFSAVNHDHLFVPYEDGQRAIEALRALQLSLSPPSRIQ